MASFKWAFTLTIILLATGSVLIGCGKKEEEQPTFCQPGTSFSCTCPPNNAVGVITCQPSGAFTPCDCSGAGTAATGDTSAISGAAGTAVTDEQPAEAAEGAAPTTGAGGKSATATKKKSCPDGFTCSLDALLKKAYVCNPPDTNTLICTTKDDCKKIGLDADCVQGPGFSACTKMCEP
jgi:hypothetical protein